MLSPRARVERRHTRSVRAERVGAVGEEDLGDAGPTGETSYVELRPAKVPHLRIDVDVFQEQAHAGRAVEGQVDTGLVVVPSQSVYKYSAP